MSEPEPATEDRPLLDGPTLRLLALRGALCGGCYLLVFFLVSGLADRWRHALAWSLLGLLLGLAAAPLGLPEAHARRGAPSGLRQVGAGLITWLLGSFLGALAFIQVIALRNMLRGNGVGIDLEGLQEALHRLVNAKPTPLLVFTCFALPYACACLLRLRSAPLWRQAGLGLLVSLGALGVIVFLQDLGSRRDTRTITALIAALGLTLPVSYRLADALAARWEEHLARGR